jgi:probable rRNA maturation factor
MTARITLLIDEPKWKKPAAFGARLKKAAQAAFSSAGGRSKAELTILLADDARLKDLNTTFRGKKKTTNVLSFPSEEPGYLGDVAIAWGVTAREAAESGKSFADHACHLTVHGVLHLMGYDHETDKDAKKMERLEVKILKGLGIADPYRVRA